MHSVLFCIFLLKVIVVQSVQVCDANKQMYMDSGCCGGDGHSYCSSTRLDNELVDMDSRLSVIESRLSSTSGVMPPSYIVTTIPPMFRHSYLAYKYKFDWSKPNPISYFPNINTYDTYCNKSNVEVYEDYLTTYEVYDYGLPTQYKTNTPYNFTFNIRDWVITTSKFTIPTGMSDVSLFSGPSFVWGPTSSGYWGDCALGKCDPSNKDDYVPGFNASAPAILCTQRWYDFYLSRDGASMSKVEHMSGCKFPQGENIVKELILKEMNINVDIFQHLYLNMYFKDYAVNGRFKTYEDMVRVAGDLAFMKVDFEKGLYSFKMYLVGDQFPPQTYKGCTNVKGEENLLIPLCNSFCVPAN